MSTPTNLLDLAKAVLARSEDDAFMAALRHDPGKAIREHLGVTFAPSDVIPDDELDGVVGGVGAIGGAGPLNVQGLDLEAAMMAIQSQRAELLEGQLTNQIQTIEARNQLIGGLNEVLGAVGTVDATADTQGTWTAKDNAALDKWLVEHKDQLDKAGLGDLYSQAQRPGDVNGAEIAATLKGQIDTLNNAQQIDMLRMQSLTNKRNEAFDLMTNFIRKMADSRSAILGNMR